MSPGFLTNLLLNVLSYGEFNTDSGRLLHNLATLTVKSYFLKFVVFVETFVSNCLSHFVYLWDHLSQENFYFLHIRLIACKSIETAQATVEILSFNEGCVQYKHCVLLLKKRKEVAIIKT